MSLQAIFRKLINEFESTIIERTTGESIMMSLRYMITTSYPLINFNPEHIHISISENDVNIDVAAEFIRELETIYPEALI